MWFDIGDGERIKLNKVSEFAFEIVDWQGIKFNGKELPCNQDNADMLMENPIFYKIVDSCASTLFHPH